jgi:hypothetical protein
MLPGRWAIGVHEALDQCGALFGPLVVAAVLALRGEYKMAFIALLVPTVVTLIILVVARLFYSRPEGLEATPPTFFAGRFLDAPSLFLLICQYVLTY